MSDQPTCPKCGAERVAFFEGKHYFKCQSLKHDGGHFHVSSECIEGLADRALEAEASLAAHKKRSGEAIIGCNDRVNELKAELAAVTRELEGADKLLDAQTFRSDTCQAENTRLLGLLGEIEVEINKAPSLVSFDYIAHTCKRIKPSDEGS